MRRVILDRTSRLCKDAVTVTDCVIEACVVSCILEMNVIVCSKEVGVETHATRLA